MGVGAGARLRRVGLLEKKGAGALLGTGQEWGAVGASELGNYLMFGISVTRGSFATLFRVVGSCKKQSERCYVLYVLERGKSGRAFSL